MGNSISYKIKQATADDIKWISELEASVYSGNDAVPLTVLMDWYKANPNSFWIITSDNKIAGHIDILPIKEEVMNKFVRGEIVEQDIKGKDIFSLSEREKVRDLYIESLAFNMDKGFLRSKVLLLIISAFREIAGKICYPVNIQNLYAISASDEGSALLKHLGFKIINKASKRKDRHNLFMSTFHNFTQKVKEWPEND